MGVRVYGGKCSVIPGRASAMTRNPTALACHLEADSEGGRDAEECLTLGESAFPFKTVKAN
jgi:hypothetical protein